MQETVVTSTKGRVRTVLKQPRAEMMIAGRTWVRMTSASPCSLHTCDVIEKYTNEVDCIYICSHADYLKKIRYTCMYTVRSSKTTQKKVASNHRVLRLYLCCIHAASELHPHYIHAALMLHPY